MKKMFVSFVKGCFEKLTKRATCLWSAFLNKTVKRACKERRKNDEFD
jgi:hypothetical protein